MPNRLNVEIQKDGLAFAKTLATESSLGSSPDLSNWINLAHALASLSPACIKVKLEDEVVLLVALVETTYDCQTLFSGGRSPLLKTMGAIMPGPRKTRLLLALTPTFPSGGTPFLRHLESEVEKYSWQIILGTMTALMKKGNTELLALGALPEPSLGLLGQRDLHDYACVPSDKFLQGLTAGSDRPQLPTGKFLVRHKMHLINNQLRQAFEAVAVR